MKKNKKQSTLLLIVILLAVSIGFALLSTTLKINGVTGVKKNTWSVYWDSLGDIVKTDGVVVNQEAIINQNDNTLVNFDVLLNVPGDYYEFQVDAVNAGTLNAMLDIVSVVINDDEDEELPNYLEFSVKYADDKELVPGHLLAKADSSTTPPTVTRERYKVRIKFKDTITPEELDNIPEDSYSIQVKIPYKQADDTAEDRHLTKFTVPSGKTKDTLEIGDELCADTECFDFIRYDNNDLVLITKYNLNVGGPHPLSGDVTYLQDSRALGYEWNSGNRYCAVPYSGANGYWYGSMGIYEQYRDDPQDAYKWPAHTFDLSKDGAPGTETYSVAYYVKKYEEKLSEKNIHIESARIPDYSDVFTSDTAGELTLSFNNPKCQENTPAFIKRTSFWTQLAIQDQTMVGIRSTGNNWTGCDATSVYADQGSYYYYGVRPIVVVSKTNVK